MAKLTIPIIVDWDSIKDRLAEGNIVEVVRCGKCKHSRDYKHTKDYVNCEVDSSESIDRDPNWYCADGERRTDDE